MITEEEFLARRGDRALRLGFGECPTDEIGLVLRPPAFDSAAARPAAVLAANLLARWVPKLTIDLPDGGEGLAEDVEAAARLANPFLEVRRGRPEGPSLALGPGVGTANEITAWADGWVAISTRGAGRVHLVEPVASTVFLAVTLGVARVFRDAWQLKDQRTMDVRWDTWLHAIQHDRGSHVDHPLPTGAPELGRVLQVGAGAVGSSIIYLLGLLGASADVVLLDHDVVKIENLDRSLLFGRHHASPRQMPKVEASVMATEEFPALRIEPIRSKWAAYARDGYRVGDFDLALALANEDEVWPAMARAVLPVTLQATTDTEWGVAMGIHAPGTAYCLRCRFPPGGEALPGICSVGSVEIERASGRTDTVHASLPFQSASAAALLAIEVEKLNLEPVARAPNYVEAPLHQTENLIALYRPASPRCPACRHFPEDLWTRKYGSSRFGRRR